MSAWILQRENPSDKIFIESVLQKLAQIASWCLLFSNTLGVFLVLFFSEAVPLKNFYNYFLIANCNVHARLYNLPLSSVQSSEISARHHMQHSTAAVGFDFISHFLGLCAVAGTLSHPSSLLSVYSLPHLFSVESYTVRCIRSGVFSE